MNTALIPLADMERMATAMAKSNLFGVKTPDQALSLMLLSQAQGIHPAQAAVDYHIIQGRPSLTTNAILSRFQQSGGKVEYHIYTDQECKATFSHPNGGSLTLNWTFDQAKRAGLTGKDNWKMYARAMLRSRVIAEGVRAVYPAVLGGMYSQEEVSDFDARPTSNQPAEKVVEGEVVAGEDMLKDILHEIECCETLDCLKEVYIHGKNLLRGNRTYLEKLSAKKDEIKAVISEKMAAEADE